MALLWIKQAAKQCDLAPRMFELRIGALSPGRAATGDWKMIAGTELRGQLCRLRARVREHAHSKGEHVNERAAHKLNELADDALKIARAGEAPCHAKPKRL